MYTNDVEQNQTCNGQEKRKVSVASWIDLLGYGQQISDANFDPNDSKAHRSHTRLAEFREIVSNYSKCNDLKNLVLNDGAVVYQDLTCSSNDTLSFFNKSWELYSAVNQHERKEYNGDYRGARMILASGFRFPGRKAGNEDTKNKLKEFIKELLENNNNFIDKDAAAIDAAIDAAMKIELVRPPFDILPQLQENFAFSRAYIAEKSGRSGNLPGPKFYVDLNIFRCREKFEPYVEWSCSRLKLAIDFAKFTINDAVNNQDICEVIISSGEMNDKHQVAELLEHKSKLFSVKSCSGILPVIC